MVSEVWSGKDVRIRGVKVNGCSGKYTVRWKR